MRYSVYTQPSGISRRTIVISVGLHLLIFLVILASPYLKRNKKVTAAAKYFQIVNVSAPPSATPAPPKPIEKPKPAPPPKETKAKPKLAPAIVPKSEPVPESKPAPVEAEPEYSVPVEAMVTNQAFGQYDWYLATIESKVQNNWDPPRGIPGEEDLSVVVVFLIQRTGEITGIRLDKSSGDQQLDRLGLRAIERAGPFPRLPPRFTEETLEVAFKLNYTR